MNILRYFFTVIPLLLVGGQGYAEKNQLHEYIEKNQYWAVEELLEKSKDGPDVNARDEKNNKTPLHYFVDFLSNPERSEDIEELNVKNLFNQFFIKRAEVIEDRSIVKYAIDMYHESKTKPLKWLLEHFKFLRLIEEEPAEKLERFLNNVKSFQTFKDEFKNFPYRHINTEFEYKERKHRLLDFVGTHIRNKNVKKEIVKYLVHEGAFPYVKGSDELFRMAKEERLSGRPKIFDIQLASQLKLFNSFVEYGCGLPGVVAEKYHDIQGNLINRDSKKAVIDNLRDKDGKTLLHVAANHGNKLMIEELSKRWADFNVKDLDRQTPIFSLVEGAVAKIPLSVDLIGLADYFIKKGANLSYKYDGKDDVLAFTQKLLKSTALVNKDVIETDKYKKLEALYYYLISRLEWQKKQQKKKGKGEIEKLKKDIEIRKLRETLSEKSIPKKPKKTKKKKFFLIPTWLKKR